MPMPMQLQRSSSTTHITLVQMDAKQADKLKFGIIKKIKNPTIFSYMPRPF